MPGHSGGYVSEGVQAELKKHVDKLGLEGWEFIGKYLDAHKAPPKEEKPGEVKKPTVEPKEKYLMDIVAGRPIFGHPCAVGGFRLRYGRARTSACTPWTSSWPSGPR